MENFIRIFTDMNQDLIKEINIGLPMVLKHYLIFKFEIILGLFLLDLLLLGLMEFNCKLYYGIKFKLVKKPLVLIKTYKLHKGINNLISSIRPRYIRYGIQKEKKLIHYIYKDNLMTYIKQLIIGLFNPKDISTIIAMILTISLYYEIQVSSLISEYLQLVNKENLMFFLTILPVITIILGIIVGWKYTSLKGRIERGANRLNHKIIEETLDIHRRLIKSLLVIIDKGSKNIEYTLNCKNLLIQSKLRKISPLIEGIENNEVIWNENYFYRNPYKIDDYMFEDIEEIEQLVNLIKEAKQKNIFNEIFWIRYYKRDMLGIKHFNLEVEELKNKFQFYLFTPYTFKKLLKEDNEEIIYKEIQKHMPEDEANRRYYESQILKDIKNFKERVDDILVEAIEILIDLSLYHKSIYRLLHFDSNKLGRALSLWTDKE